MRRFVLGILACVCLVAGRAEAQTVEVKIISWNLESGDASPEHLAEQMKAKGPIDLWGFSELASDADLKKYETALKTATGMPYTSHTSHRGGNDRLGIMYNSGRFTPVPDADGKITFELSSVLAGNPGLRPAFGIRLRGKKTGQEFFFVVNHFKAMGGPEELKTRKKQVAAMNDFAATQSIPVLMCGDLNIPYYVATGKSEETLKQLTTDGRFEWIEPAVKVKTQASNYNSILDYVMVANKVAGWTGESFILNRDGNFPATPADAFEDDDDKQETDHRPVLAILRLDVEEEIEALDEQIAELESRLAELKSRRAALRPSNPTSAVRGATTGPVFFRSVPLGR